MKNSVFDEESNENKQKTVQKVWWHFQMAAGSLCK